ncbi:hypothetical protein IWZ01DRAFT_166762 [Phyllosticta capitalensis]
MPSLKSRRHVCGLQEYLLQCSVCQAVSYCGEEHQAADRSAHRERCKDIVEKRFKLEQEENVLRSMPEDFAFPQPVFEKGAGCFYGICETREYMRARCDYANSLAATETIEGNSLALDHSMDMIRLNRSDNLGMRSLIPTLLMRLGREQECYDFLKWWAKTSQDEHYDWGDTDLPHLDIKNADVFESVDLFCKKFFDLGGTFVIMLLKTKILLDLRALQRSPQRTDTLCTTLVQSRKDKLQARGLQRLAGKLEAQIRQLYKRLKNSYINIWFTFLYPGPSLTGKRCEYTPGEYSEVQIALQDFYQVWTESPGSMNVIRHLMAQDPDFPNTAYELF